jgi:hypothetical protein
MAIDLKKFCGVGDGKWTESPFVCRGWKYATNGYVAIRVPTTEPDASEYWSPAAELFWAYAWPFSECNQPWPESSPTRGRASCPICGGWADTLLHCDHCDAEGMVEQDLYQVIGEHRIGIASDRLIRTLPNVLWAKDQPQLRRAVAFTFDGGQGLVAPLL